VSLPLDVAALVGGGIALWIGATWAVEGASKVAGALGISNLVIGLTVVAFGTSAPEFAVTIGAAVSGAPDVSVGNVVGSNVFNLAFVLGGVATVRAFDVDPSLSRRDGVVLIASTLLAVGLLWDLRLSRLDGVVLGAALLAYLGYLVRTGAAPRHEASVESDGVELRDVGRAVLGLLLILGGAQLLVDGAVSLATAAGLPDWVIGTTVVAVGTSLPEFATSLVAARRGFFGVSAGNVVGSNVFNVLGVLGLTGIVAPLSVASAATAGFAWLLAISAVVTVAFFTGHHIRRLEGALLVAVGVAFWVVTVL